jgi:hypothetical protein
MSLQQKSLRRSSEDHWIPLSDLMTGLMMVFLVIAMLFMIKVEREAKQAVLQSQQIAEQAETIKAIAALYGDVRAKIYDEMYRTFKDDLPVWHASLAKDLSVRFEEPSVQFDIGQSILKPEFSRILSIFFPAMCGFLTLIDFATRLKRFVSKGIRQASGRIWQRSRLITRTCASRRSARGQFYSMCLACPTHVTSLGGLFLGLPQMASRLPEG